MDNEILGDGTIYVTKSKALISWVVTAQLICAFVLALWFSHDAANICILSVTGQYESLRLELESIYGPQNVRCNTVLQYGVVGKSSGKKLPFMS